MTAYETPKQMRDAARAHVVRSRSGSASKLSRTIGVPYHTAASLLDELETEGLVSAPDAKTGKRHVRDEHGRLEQPRHRPSEPLDVKILGGLTRLILRLRGRDG